MTQQSGEALKKLADELYNKHKKTIDDEQQAIAYYNQAIETQELAPVAMADCYSRCSEIYRDRKPHTPENYDHALRLITKASEVPGLPSWYTPQGNVEKLAMCPEIYGFLPDKRDKELAWNMHSQNLMIQNGGDLAITASNWFGFLEGYDGQCDPEWISIGFDYLNKAIENGWDDLWTSIMYCTYGKACKYFAEKTEENFNSAIDWFKKAIEMDVDANSSNQPWSIIGKGSARAFFELAELLSDPVRFGFDESLKNAQEGQEKYQQGKDHLSRYGSLGPYAILENMFVDVWKKSMMSSRKEEDMETIEDLCRFGKEVDQNKINSLSLFEAVARHTLKDKSNENYTAILQSYYDCLQACTPEAGGKNWIGEQASKWATALVLDPVSEGFSAETKDLEITKKLKQFFEDVSNNPEEAGFSEKIKEIIDINTKLHSVQLPAVDDIMQARLKASFDFILKKMKEDRAAADKEVEKLNDVKLKLKDVQSDMQLFGYYDGFIFTLSQAYTTAQVVSSGQVVLDSGPNPMANLGIKAVSYIPFIGNAISDPLSSIAEYMKGGQMIQEANNVCTIATNQTGFDEIFQDSILEYITLKKDEIKNYKEDSLIVKTWYDKIAGFLLKIKVNLQTTVYGLRFKTPAQRLGNQHATELIGEWLSSGKIYGEKPFLLPDESKTEVVRILLLPPVERPEIQTAAAELANQAKAECCNIF